ncbi:MAG: hypothetical protein HYY25_13370 [Candidatus Wallbacteria bacterium]|nr:hypothetical protein [Candidatus Wallbacteria bacterium]
MKRKSTRIKADEIRASRVILESDHGMLVLGLNGGTGCPFISLADADRNCRVSLTLKGENGKQVPVFTLMDEAGRERSMLRVDENEAILHLMNAAGAKGVEIFARNEHMSGVTVRSELATASLTAVRDWSSATVDGPAGAVELTSRLKENGPAMEMRREDDGGEWRTWRASLNAGTCDGSLFARWMTGIHNRVYPWLRRVLRPLAVRFGRYCAPGAEHLDLD